MFSWKTLWKSERIHRLLICCLFFTLKPLSDLPRLLLNFMPVHTSVSHTVRFQRPGKELRKGQGMEGEMVEAVGFPRSMHSEKPRHLYKLALSGSKNDDVYSPTNAWNQFVQGQLLQRQLVNIPSTSGYVAFEQTTLPPF